MPEPMADLNPIAERIVTVNGMPALLVPRNLRRIRSPVIFFAVKFFQNRRIELRRDAKVDMRTFDRARATLGDLIDLCRMTNCPVFGTVSVTCSSPGTCASSVKPNVSRYQILPCSKSVTSIRTWLILRERHDFSLRFVAHRIAANRKAPTCCRPDRAQKATALIGQGAAYSPDHGMRNFLSSRRAHDIGKIFRRRLRNRTRRLPTAAPDSARSENPAAPHPNPCDWPACKKRSAALRD